MQRLKGGAARIIGGKESEMPLIFNLALIAAFILCIGRLLVKSQVRFDKAK